MIPQYRFNQTKQHKLCTHPAAAQHCGKKIEAIILFDRRVSNSKLSSEPTRRQVAPMDKVVPNGSYCRKYWTSNSSKLQITILLKERKNSIDAEMNNSFIYMLFKFDLQV